MDTCKLPFLFLWLSISVLVPIHNDAHNLTFRKKRQSGYVYDKPNVSFDLPSRGSPAASGAPSVTQMHMYYAYPVPSSGKSGAAQPTQAAGSTSGNNYANQNTAVQAGGNTGTASGSSGYNYKRPDLSTNQPTGNKENGGYTSTGLSAPAAGGGYQTGTPGGYSSVNSVTNGGATDGSPTSGGYNYEIKNNVINQMGGNIVGISGYTSRTNQGSRSTANAVITDTGSITRPSSGYNYDNQKTGGSQGMGSSANIGYSGSGILDSASNTADGYNYEKQNNAGGNTASFGDTSAPTSTGNTGGQAVGNMANRGYSGSGSTATDTVGGYNYDKQSVGVEFNVDNAITASVGLMGIESNAGNDGYNYNAQDTGVNQVAGNRVSIGNSANIAADSSTGYNYGNQNVDTNQPVLNTGGNDISGYNYEKQNIEVPLITNREIIGSTIAPSYLPPLNSFKPIDMYLPPKESLKSLDKPSESYVPALTTNSPFLPKLYLSTAYLTPTKSDSVSVQKQMSEIRSMPSPQYIPPTIKPSQPDASYIPSNNPINQKVTQQNEISTAVKTNGHQYLPPTNSYSPTVAPPAFTYLPPV